MDERRTRAAGGSASRSRPHLRAAWWLLGSMALPAVALAQLDFPPPVTVQTHFTPYADASYEQNSNLFDLSDSQPEAVGHDGPSRSDRLLRARIGFDSAYDWSRQEFFLIAEARRFDYDHFTQLNHNEYLVHGGWKWQIASVLDGLLDVSRERSIVPFLQFDETLVPITQLYLQVQTVGTASINVQVTPEWRLESQGKINNQDSPRPGLPDLQLRENSIQEGIRYVGFANLSAGIDGSYLQGRFSNGVFFNEPNYHQTTGDLAADYTLSGLSTFHGAIGYTDRVLEQAGHISGLTGLLSYERQLTGKTSIVAKLSRAINTYISAATPEVDTAAELDVAWNATEKIKVAAGYQWLHSSFSETQIAGVITASRVDRIQTPILSVRYQPFDWLLVRPYGQYQTRSSSIAFYSFNATVYGIELEARLPFQ